MGVQRKREEFMSKREFAEFVYENLFWDGVEALFSKDGVAWARESGKGSDGDEIAIVVPLSFEYWSKSWVLEDLYDYDLKEGVGLWKEITDEHLKNHIIDGIEDEIFGFYS